MKTDKGKNDAGAVNSVNNNVDTADAAPLFGASTGNTSTCELNNTDVGLKNKNAGEPDKNQLSAPTSGYNTSGNAFVSGNEFHSGTVTWTNLNALFYGNTTPGHTATPLFGVPNSAALESMNTQRVTVNAVSSAKNHITVSPVMELPAPPVLGPFGGKIIY